MLQNERMQAIMIHRARKDIAALGVAVAEKTGRGILSGLEVTAQTVPDMTVAITGGICYKPDGARHVVAAALAQAINAADAAKDRIDILYVDTDGALVYLPGNIEIDAVAGARAYTVAVNAVADDTITIDGEVFTAVAADAGTDEFVPGESAAATATALAACIASNAVLSALYTVTNPSSGVVLLTETVAGGLDTPGEATFTGTVEITNSAPTASVAYAAGGAAPALPSGGTAVAEINVDAEQTAVETADITDKRTWTVPALA